MFDNLILLSILVMGSLGLLLAILLVIAYLKFRVVEDPKVIEIEKVLPAINCGACGYASCLDYAKKLASGEADISACVAGGEEVMSR